MIAYVGEEENDCNRIHFHHHHQHNNGRNNIFDELDELPMTTTINNSEQDEMFQGIESEDDDDDDYNYGDDNFVGDFLVEQSTLKQSQPSLTPTPQTPTTEEVDVSYLPNSSRHHEEQQIESNVNQVEEIEVECNILLKNYHQGPALVGSLTKSLEESDEQDEDDGNDDANDDDENETDSVEDLEGEEPEEAADTDEADVGSISITNKLINPAESEYFSDPDFHDERPGKKSFSELEEERKLRRKRLARQLVFNNSSSGDNEEEEEADADPLFESTIATHTSDIEEQEQEEDVNNQESSPDDESDNEITHEESYEMMIEDSCDVTIESSEHANPSLAVRSNDDDDDDDTSQDITSLSAFVSAPSQGGEEPMTEVVVQLAASEDYRENASAESSDSSRGSSPDTINSIVQSVNLQVAREELVNDDDDDNNFEMESECQVTASEANAELFVDESTLAEDVCTSFKLDSNTTGCQFGSDSDESGDINLNDDHEHQQSDNDNDVSDEEDDDTLNGFESVKNILECQASLDDIKQEVLNNNLVEPIKIEEEIVENNNNKEDELPEDVGRRSMLIEMVSEYCDKLVELIKLEALKQIELISSKENEIKRINLTHMFQIESSVVPMVKQAATGAMEAEKSLDIPEQETVAIRSDEKKIYTSSMFYNDQLESFPTIEQQLERCRTIAHQLENATTSNEDAIESHDKTKNPETRKDIDLTGNPAELIPCQTSVPEALTTFEINSIRRQNTNDERASEMFRSRRERMSQFTLESQKSENDLEKDYSLNSFPSVSRPRRASLEPAHLLNFHRRRKKKTPEEGNISKLINYDSLETIVDGLDCDPANMTDTEYEAPRVRRRPLPARATTTPPFGNETSRLVVKIEEMNVKVGKSQRELIKGNSLSGSSGGKFRPFLDSSTLKDIERLREWCPYGEFNEHNSVSPELCRQLVQGLKGNNNPTNSFDVTATLPTTPPTLDLPKVIVDSVSGRKQSLQAEVDEVAVVSTGKQLAASSSGSKKDKGAQLFERRQLQSSDWIVSNDPPTQATLSTTTTIATTTTTKSHVAFTNDTSRKSDIKPAEVDKQTHDDHNHLMQQLSKPSLSEETVMVADESSDQFIELMPIIMSHSLEPRLQLATVTKTPSFSASSWRVIECDSPDLLTSHEDGEETQDDDNENGLDDDNIQSATHNEDDDDCDPNSVTSGDHDTIGMERKELFSPVTSDNQAMETEEQYSGTIDDLNQFDNYNHRTQVKRETQNKVEMEEDGDEPDHSGMEKYYATTLATTRARSQSRSGDVHKSTILHWRPQVTTPTWMSTYQHQYPNNQFNRETEEINCNISSIKNQELNTNKSVIVSQQKGDEQIMNCHNKSVGSCKPMMINNNRHNELTNRRHPSVVSLIRNNYQNLINESANNTYRCYRYPFADQDNEPNRRRGRSCSIIRSSEPAPYTGSANYFPSHEQQQQQQQQDNFEGPFIRQSSEPRYFAARHQENSTSRMLQTTQFSSTNSYSPKPLIEEDEEEYRESLNENDHLMPTNRMPGDRTRYASDKIELSRISHHQLNGQRSQCTQWQPNDSTRYHNTQDKSEDFRRKSSSCSLGFDQNQNKTLPSNNWQQTEQQSGDSLVMSESWRSKLPTSSGDHYDDTPIMQTEMKDFSRQILLESNDRHHYRKQPDQQHIIRNTNTNNDYGQVVDRKSHFSGNNSGLHGRNRESARDGATSGCSCRCSSCSGGRANVYCLRVDIKLPNKSHRIVIYRRPKITFATLINQQ